MTQQIDSLISCFFILYFVLHYRAALVVSVQTSGNLIRANPTLALGINVHDEHTCILRVEFRSKLVPENTRSEPEIARTEILPTFASDLEWRASTLRPRPGSANLCRRSNELQSPHVVWPHSEPGQSAQWPPSRKVRAGRFPQVHCPKYSRQQARMGNSEVQPTLLFSIIHEIQYRAKHTTKNSPMYIQSLASLFKISICLWCSLPWLDSSLARAPSWLSYAS